MTQVNRQSSSTLGSVQKVQTAITSSRTKEGRREAILMLEATCRNQTQVEVPIRHYFANGVYAREMYLSKGTLVVGKIHNFESIGIISKGKVLVITDEGQETLEAPYTFVGKSGVKRVIHALEDTIWTTFHTSIDDDLEQIENHHIASSYEQYKLGQGIKYDVGSNRDSSINRCKPICEQTCSKEGAETTTSRCSRGAESRGVCGD